MLALRVSSRNHDGVENGLDDGVASSAGISISVQLSIARSWRNSNSVRPHELVVHVSAETAMGAVDYGGFDGT